jgi:hypothetical protein
MRFCLSIAVISAAIADPVVEFCSNSGLFGPGRFTDRTNLDVIPALAAGVALLALFMVRRARAILAERALPCGWFSLLPLIFGLQIATLFVMETAEQLVAFGHVIGPMTWLGGPVPASIAVHALVSIAVTVAIARSRRTLAATALRVIRLISALATFPVRGIAPVAARRFVSLSYRKLSPVLCAIGERAPPITLG